MSFRNVFKREELKYLLDETQYEAMQAFLPTYMREDEYGRSTIGNLYFDTPNYRIIRHSLDKPVYKEKLRLRCYGVPGPDSYSFVELKKKYRGTVYKRRVCLLYREAYDWLCGDAPPPKDTQMIREVQWFRQVYAPVKPVILIAGERTALFDRENPELRLTFDENIRFRTDDLDLQHGMDGRSVLEPGQYLMEIKVSGAMPLWLAQALGRWHIYPISFSKYGTAYRQKIQEQAAIREDLFGD